MIATSIKDVLNNFISNILTKENFYLKIGKVLVVDLINYKFFFEPNDGSPKQFATMAVIDSISNSIIIVPEINSIVIVAYTNKEDAYCISVEKASEILINSGLNGGLINIIPQTTKLNLLVSEMQAELVKIATGITGAGGAYTPGTLSQFNKNDYEDTNVKH